MRNRRMSVAEAAGRWPDLAEFWIAPGGSGPHAANWADKPHRLVYDLIMLVAEARAERDQLKEQYERHTTELGPVDCCCGCHDGPPIVGPCTCCTYGLARGPAKGRHP